MWLLLLLLLLLSLRISLNSYVSVRVCMIKQWYDWAPQRDNDRNDESIMKLLSMHARTLDTLGPMVPLSSWCWAMESDNSLFMISILPNLSTVIKLGPFCLLMTCHNAICHAQRTAVRSNQTVRGTHKKGHFPVCQMMIDYCEKR